MNQHDLTPKIGTSEKPVPWNLIAICLVLMLSVLLIILLDTGRLADWIARHNQTKIDEVIVVAIALVGAMALYSVRKWIGLSQQIKNYEKHGGTEHLTETSRLKKTQSRDLIGLSSVLLVAIISVFFLDTGALADWIARHKDTKVDEVIVVTILLVIGLSFFSIRRWMELSTQLTKYEELYRKTTRLNRESALLSELSDLLQSCLSSEEAHELIANRAQVLFPGSAGSLCVTASSRDLVEVVGTWGEPSLAERFFAPKDCWALRRGRVHVLEGNDSSLTCAHVGKTRPEQAMCLPMMAHGEALGLLYLEIGGKPKDQSDTAAQLSESEQRLARTFAEQAALALANLRMREILRIQSVRDPLTGLYNRRYMEESLERELRRAARKNCPLGVMMLDVDHFKRYNDTYGHEAGDSVLRALGNLFRTQFRGEDVVCRYGGEEFTIILPEASLEVTQLRAEQLRESAKQIVAQLRSQSLETVSLSIGVSSFPENGSTGEALLQAADAALYRAKEEGRDRVLVA